MENVYKYDFKDLANLKPFAKLAADSQNCSRDAIKSMLALLESNLSKNQQKEKLIKIGKVCEILSVSRPTVYKYLNNGILHRCNNLPDSILRFRESDVYSLLEDRKN